MKAAFVVLLVLLLAMSTLAVSVEKTSMTKKAKIFKLNAGALSKDLNSFIEQPGWMNSCDIDCSQGKQLVKDLLCAIGRKADGKTQGPFTDLLGFPDDQDAQSLSSYSKKCQDIVQEVVLDCALLKKGKLSCGTLRGCENGGFYLRMNNAKIKKYTGFEVKQPIFIKSEFFRKMRDKKLCPKKPIAEPMLR